MYCTPLHDKRPTFYWCLSFMLVMGLLFYQLCDQEDGESWDEMLLLRQGWQLRLGRLCRRGRWVVGFTMVMRRGRVWLCRTGLIAILLVWSGWWRRHPLSWVVLGLPGVDYLLWLLPLWWPAGAKGRVYPHVVRWVHDLYRLAVVMLFCEAVLPGRSSYYWCLVSGCVRTADGAQAAGWIEDDGTWHLEMAGAIIFTYQPRDAFEERILLTLLRQFRTPQSSPKRPFLRQEWLAEWFDTHQELISRWQRYVRTGGLEKLNGAYDGWVVTPELRQAILEIWVPNFWLGATEVRERLLAAGHIAFLDAVSETSIYRVAEETGWAEVRRLLRPLFKFTAEGPTWRDDVLINRLFEINARLLTMLQTGTPLTPQLTLEIASLKQGLGVSITPLEKPLPYAYRLQRALFGQWEEIDDGSVCCPQCGSNLVRRKENKPCHKRYRDPETATWRQAEGYRYFCLNPACPCQTFTDYPDDVRLYSPTTVNVMVWGVMVYMRMRTTYRLAAEAVGVSHVTLWRWAMMVGDQALPVATLFGVVRSSGVVGIDEKWVLVPKNDKPEGKLKRWMYVYMAVDVYTYDLLHIDIYPYTGKTEARAFLQALKSKGYSPCVILTDMNQDYHQPIRTVFPQAIHHECVFHALQQAQRLVKDVYGNDYTQTHPEAVSLKNQLYTIFRAKSKKTVHKRYREVISLRESYVAQTPEAHRIFDFLERHYPKLVNAVENPLIPLTNNTVELVNRRFDQHYQNMCGFDGIETARKYLNLFELTYRFTPFATDNRLVEDRNLDIRGKCPLELAGYDITTLPIAQVIRARLLQWPLDTLHGSVQNA
jgi:transposase-like protein